MPPKVDAERMVCGHGSQQIWISAQAPGFSLLWLFVILDAISAPLTNAQRDPPVLVGVTPPNGATVEPMSVLAFEFNEEVHRGDGRILLMREPLEYDNSAEPLVVVLGPGGTMDFPEKVLDRRLIITPKQPLAQSEQCVAIALELNVVRSKKGIAFEGTTATGAGYRVCMGDSVPPQLVSIKPAAGAMNLPSSTNYILHFDEHVRIDIVRLISVAVEIESGKEVALEASQPEVAPYLVILKPTVFFQLGKTYELRLSSGGITDMNGNDFEGVGEHEITIAGAMTVVASVEGSEQVDESDLTWLWVVVGVANGGCLCAIAAWRLQVASREARARYQSTVEPISTEHSKSNIYADEEGKGRGPASYKSKGAQTPKAPPTQSSSATKTIPSSYTSDGLGSKSPSGKNSHFASDEDRFNASTASNFSSTRRSSKSTDWKQASQTNGAQHNSSQGRSSTTSSTTPKVKKEVNEAEDALERSGVQIGQAREIGESLYRQMDERRNDPIADRKRFFKELLLKWHPDKSSSEFAKDVVRFLQAQKDWFLKE